MDLPSSMSPKWVVIIPAAGVGKRFGASRPKQFLPLAERPILVHTVERVLSLPASVRVVIAAHVDMIDDTYGALVGAGVQDATVAIVPGGEERQDSVRKALDHPWCQEADIIFVHDAVRPLATHAVFLRVAEAAIADGAAIPVIPVTDTIKERSACGLVVATPRRDTLCAVQTPQAFRRGVLHDAHRRALDEGWVGTDDASFVERCRQPVRCVDGEPWNIKITSPSDLHLAEYLFKEQHPDYHM
jgi:2-C-methyl-D-erythritol 4-phosphate cytidylyltransferase